MTDKYKIFIETIIEQTASKVLHWTDLFDYAHHRDFDGSLQFLFYQGEFRTIHELDSYIAEIDQSFIALISETIESGMDGSIKTEKNLYFLENINAPIHAIPATPYQIEDLYAVIRTINARNYIDMEDAVTRYLQKFDHAPQDVSEPDENN